MFLRLDDGLIRFRLLQFRIDESGRLYALLPKLCAQQITIIRERLEKVGYSVSWGETLRGVGRRAVLTVDPRGVCWSNDDIADCIGPVVPRMLAAKKQVVPLHALVSQYFQAKSSEGGFVVRFLPRMESSQLWEKLRATGQCALSPDEHAVFRAILASASGECRVLSDYPTRDCAVRIIGKRQYYESMVEPAEAASNLRMVGSKGTRNVYLPKDGLMRFQDLKPPVRSEMAEMLRSSGEWCYLSVRP